MRIQQIMVSSQIRRKPSSIVDTLKKGIDTTSLAHADSTVIDSVRIRFLPGMGQIIDEVDTTDVLHQKQFLWSDAKYVGDLLWKLPGFFYRDLGEAGKWGQLNAFGVDGRDIGILLDGRPMNDPVTGTYNLSDLPLEFIDHTELLSGSTSILASGEDGHSIEFCFAFVQQLPSADETPICSGSKRNYSDRWPFHTECCARFELDDRFSRDSFRRKLSRT